MTTPAPPPDAADLMADAIDLVLAYLRYRDEGAPDVVTRLAAAPVEVGTVTALVALGAAAIRAYSGRIGMTPHDLLGYWGGGIEIARVELIAAGLRAPDHPDERL